MRANLLLIGMLATGCHKKLKAAAPHIDDINIQVVTTGAPYVQLGKVYGGPSTGDAGADLIGEIAATAINVAQDIRSINQTERIAAAVDVYDVNQAMVGGIAGTLGGGPPFGYTDGEADAMLELNVTSYGVSVPYLGAPGEFTYSVQARLYDAQGDRVYRKSMTCALGLGDPGAAEIVFGTVNNVRQLNEMTDAEINDAFRNVAEYCGQRFVLKLRQHAG